MKEFIKKVGENYSKHDIAIYSAAFTYITLLSLPALLLSILYFTKIIFGSTQSVTDYISRVADSFPGGSGEILTQFTQNTVEFTGFWTGIISIVIALWGGSKLVTFFTQAINNSFGLRLDRDKSSFITTIKNKLLGIVFILFFIVVLFGSLFLGTVFETLFQNQVLFFIANFGLSFVVFTILYAFVFKFLILVDAGNKISLGAGSFIALLTILSTALITLVMNNIDFTSNYALGASIVAFLIWVNYFSTIIFLGFEIINVYLRKKGIIKYEELADEKYKKNFVVEFPKVSKILGGVKLLAIESKIGAWFLKRKIKK